ncbi:uncharacterized protein LOC110603268 [Manihot esculenta]|uniref:uncharacterized protein LOC110603268 n=1 Tax=Manihot esculenta TaxID=3983 RepID=UPI001CC44D6D|nr:uncharacterized protein LOC110603268 [Manihot esculenta]
MRGRGRRSSSRGRGDHGRGSVHTNESENINQDLVQHTALIPRPDQGERSTQGAASSTPASVHTSATASTSIGLPPIPSMATSASASAFASGSCGPTGYRSYISLVNSIMQPSDPIARRITLIFKEKLVANGFYWKNVPEEVKEFYWQEFKEKRLSLTEEVMDAWQSAWGATEYKEKCKKSSNNRKSETGGQGAGPLRHCGGSISQYRHQQQMRERLGRDPLPHELFEATHKKKGTSEFVDVRSKAIHDRFLTLKEQASQTDNDSSQASRIDEAQLYFEAVKDLLMQLVSQRQGNQPSAPGEGTSAQPPDQADEANDEDEDEDENTTHL